MKTISLFEFRKNTKEILKYAQRGQRMIMTYRGKPVCRIEPIDNDTPDSNDPFYQLYTLAVEDKHNLSNEDMDAIIYKE